MTDEGLKFLTRLLVLFTATPVHECAHAWAAEKLGDDTGRKEGRITLNPFAHMTLWGSIMLLAAGFGWGKPVRVNPANFKDPKKGMMLSALAGPASNFVMAFLATVALRFLDVAAFATQSALLSSISRVFIYIIIINVSLGVFNFLPIPPLDGSKIFNAILPDRLYFKIMRYEQYIFIALIILVYSGLLDRPLAFLQNGVLQIMLFLTGWAESIACAVFGVV